MKLSVYSGSPQSIGYEYGKEFAERIDANVTILVKRIGCVPADPLPSDDPDFIKWVDEQEAVIAINWPWLIGEMRGVAEGSQQEYRDILFLNLRVWQYRAYSGKSDTACSSMIVTHADGSVANVGALDDPSEYYCGMVKIVPCSGYSYFSFPIAGTSWGNRGINSAGLCVGASSQIIMGLKRLPGSICADIANRVILQTCATVDDVRNFCKKHPFTLNLACADKNGDVFCAHQTTAGLFELSGNAPHSITNHVVCDHILTDLLMYKIAGNKNVSFCESTTTRLRRGRLLDFISKHDKKCSAEDVRKYVADRMQGNPSSICPDGNIVLTYANPQAEPGIFWISEPQVSGDEKWTKYAL